MSNAIRIDALLPSDHDALVVLMRETWIAAFAADMNAHDVAIHVTTKLSSEAIHRYIATSAFLVALEAGQLVGFIQFGPAKPELATAWPSSLEVNRLYVAPSHQNRGIGNRLLETAFGAPEIKRAAHVLLEVWEENHGARRFYARFGFSPVGRIPFEIDGRVLGHDLLLSRPSPVNP